MAESVIPAVLPPHDLALRLQSNERRFKSITVGTWGICPGCYALAKVTRHHVFPQSRHKPAGWQGPFVILICRKCHDAVHKHCKHDDLANHITMEEVIIAIRAARAAETK